ncbi:MAG: MutS-related protein [Pirellulaceae bacterium]
MRYEIGLGLNAVSAFANLFARHSWHSPLLQNLAADVRRPYHPLPSIIATGVGWVLQLPVAYFLATQLVPLFETRLLARLRQLPGTLDLIGQGEALAAFAAQAFEHPADCFPQLAAEDPCFIATGIAHPLIPPQRSVRNDLRLDKQLQLLLVSGSNMSGKSTLLRTVGVNAVLALAGAPVRARQLTISPLLVATAMQFQDSLGCGTSFFSAVLQRMQVVLAQLDRPQPLLFLLDEILPGTNSHDRRTGAEAVMRRLVTAGAIGLVTTHDLELTQIATRLAPAATNIHFSDDVVAGKLVFDYCIRPGVVQSSNALLLMRNMGLDV